MGKKFVTAVTVALFTSALLGIPVSAQKNSKDGAGLTVPFTASGFSNGGAANITGTFTITKFARQANQLVAIGTLAATVPDGTAVRTVIRQVTLPVSNISSTPTGAASAPVMSPGAATPGASVAAAAPQAAAPDAVAPLAVSCGILHLELGPLDLDLLGLVVHLDRVVLDISADPGAGNLLGNLLCSLAGLLDSGPLSQILNQVVGLLNNLIAAL
jgi:hypothetical protein